MYGAGQGVTFNAPVAEDEASFSVVSNVKDTSKGRFGGRGAVFTRARGGQRGGRADGRAGRMQTQRPARGGAAAQQGAGGYQDARSGARPTGGAGGANAGNKLLASSAAKS